jgi:hypothetical protein
VQAGAVEVTVSERAEAWSDPIMRAVAVALARVVDQSGPSTVTAARELRAVLKAMGNGEESMIDRVRRQREETRRLPS